MRREDVKDDLRALVFDFFFRFSKLESGLKQERFLVSEKIGDKAQPSWNKFVTKFREEYEPSMGALELLELKPRRQVVAEFDLGFEDLRFPPNVALLDQVVAYVKTVRNNLFHGGKHGGDYWDDSERMRVLLSASINVLDDLSRLGGLEDHYTGNY